MVGGRGMTKGREETEKKKTFNDGITVIVAIILTREVKKKKRLQNIAIRSINEHGGETS